MVLLKTEHSQEKHVFRLVLNFIINTKKAKPQYRIGMNEILDATGMKFKKAHFADLKITINKTESKIQSEQVSIGEIKKITQPSTRKDFLGSATFFDGAFWFQFNDKHFAEIRLKTRYTTERMEIKPNQHTKRADIADWWYNCYAGMYVHIYFTLIVSDVFWI